MATTTSFAQLRAAPVQDGLRFSAADLEKMPLMGVGCQLQFRQVWVDIHEGALAQHPISQNEFLVLLATEASQQPSDTSEADPTSAAQRPHPCAALRHFRELQPSA
jgi:hypothetical protein